MATAKKTEKTAAAKEEAKSTLNSIQDTVTERASAARETLTEGFGTVRETSGMAAGAATDFGRAYYAGVTTLGRTLFGFGQEFYGEVTDHARKTMSAKSLREVAELQAAYVQNRIEVSAAHSKEFIDVARVETEKTMKPVIELLDGKRAA